MTDVVSMESEIAVAVAERYIALAEHCFATDRWSRKDAVVALEFVCRRLTLRQVDLAHTHIEACARTA